MMYIVTVEVDNDFAAVAPNDVEMMDVVANAMNAEFGDRGYRTTTVFQTYADIARRVSARFKKNGIS